MERGYVKLWRKCLDDGLLQNGPAWQLFGYLILKATHRPQRRIVGGAVFDLEPGEALFGRIKAAADLGLSEQQVRTAFSLLKRLGIVTGRATNKGTVISFVNWGKYQDERAPSRQEDTRRSNRTPTGAQPTGRPRPATNKNERTKKEERDASHLARSDARASSAPPAETEGSEKPAAFIPLADGSDFPVPASLAVEYARAYPGVDVSRELAQARAWCLSNPRQRKTKNGVRRFLNAWLDKAQNTASSPPSARRGPSRQGHFDDAGERRNYRGDNDAVSWA